MGLADLVFPSRAAKADQMRQRIGSSSNAQPYIPGPGVQPGSPAYPSNPKGGLPSNPPIGGTPPAYYS